VYTGKGLSTCLALAAPVGIRYIPLLGSMGQAVRVGSSCSKLNAVVAHDRRLVRGPDLSDLVFLSLL